jgi:putative ABC transport system substrate-binding protein
MSKKIACFVMVCTILASVPFAEAQQPRKIYRVGYLSAAFSSPTPARTEAFRQGLRELGYVEGKNLVIEYRFAEGKRKRLPELAAELVRLNVDVIFVYSTPAVKAVKKTTTSLPIVTVSGDPVRFGFVDSLAHPGGNITGLANLTPELIGKRLELFKVVIPQLSRVAVIWNQSASSGLRMRDTEAAAKLLGIKLQSLEVRRPSDFEHAFSTMKQEQADALVPLRSHFINRHIGRIAELAAENRLPAMYDSSSFTEAGGLMSYGTVIADLDRRAATYVDKILKGAKPADLPIEQPRKFDLIVNLKTAKKLGLTIPPELLLQATKVIK